jgi:hypothetical protein
LLFSVAVSIFNLRNTATLDLTPMATEQTIHAHQSEHFEDLRLSAKEFYTLLKKMIEEYRYPDVSCTPVTLKEGGLLSSKREYLRISKGRYNYYVCASPFGKSFFISWWLQENANTGANFAARFGRLGKAMAARLESKTYYELDTQLMFTSAINTLIKRAVEKVKADKGFRKDIDPAVV